MRKNKHLVLDVSTIVNLWLGKGQCRYTEELVDYADKYDLGLWVVASSLATLDYVTRQALKRRGADPEEIKEMVPSLFQDLFDRVSLLSNYGFRQEKSYNSAYDFEDAQIAVECQSLQGLPVKLVTEDADFDTLGEVSAVAPRKAVDWIKDAPDIEQVNIEFIDLTQQLVQIKPEMEERLEGVFNHHRFIMGPEVDELEGKLADYVGVDHAISCSSGTDALLMALMALNVGHGDDVITVPFTWISTAEVISLTGATPRFVDIKPDTYNLDPEKLEEAITEQTKAIIPVDLFGQMADYDAIKEIAGKHDIAVIEDAAQSFGATQDDVRAGARGVIGCTSFFPAKPFGCYGDGGACFTDDAELADRLRAIRTHGGRERHHHPFVGLNGGLDTMQAAVLLAKWPHFPEEVEARQRIGVRYTEKLQDVCTTPKIEPNNTSVYAQYTIRVPNREDLRAKLEEQDIPTAVYYPKCLHEQPAFEESGYKYGDFPVSEEASKEVMSLPMHPWLSEEDQNKVIESLEANM